MLQYLDVTVFGCYSFFTRENLDGFFFAIVSCVIFSGTVIVCCNSCFLLYAVFLYVGSMFVSRRRQHSVNAYVLDIVE